MPTLQICSAQPDNQILYVSNDNDTDADYLSSSQNYPSYESSAYVSSSRSAVGESYQVYELYDASSGSQSTENAEYASGLADYGSSYGSAEECFQIDYLVPDSDWSRLGWFTLKMTF